MRPAEVRAKEDLPIDPSNQGYLETPNNNGPERSEPQETPDEQQASITISDVHLRDEAAEQLTERVTAAIAVGQEQHSIDLAQVQADLLAKSDRDREDIRDEMRARFEAWTAQQEAERAAALLPIARKVVRDEQGRISGVIERQGDVMRRKVVERDDQGKVISVIEAVA